ncbi:MAG TPA: DinB family protein [Cyclobacteriaceae bacterium]|nr:DinB family protein [Cyclobacteriaceae bacterium]
MKKISLLLVFAGLSLSTLAQNTKTILLDQLKSTHNVKNWFVPVNIALEGLTAEQAMWTDGSGNHSAGQLAYHLLFWNTRQLNDFKGIKNDKFSGDNEETFNKFDQKQLNEVIKKLDAVLTELEKVVEQASEKQLTEWAPTIANVSAHNAYHTGQIIFVRKLQGSWNPEKGVK